jgi:hypothetical protein
LVGALRSAADEMSAVLQQIQRLARPGNGEVLLVVSTFPPI